MEIEYKWHIHSVRDFKKFLERATSLGAQPTKIKKIHIHDLYLDTPDGFFFHINLQCRIRLAKTFSQLTVKSISNSKKNVFIRTENTLQLPKFNTPKVALAHCQKNYFPSVHPLFEAINSRQLSVLTFPDGTCAEASFDQVAMLKNKKKIQFCELELEFKSGDVKTFHAFAKQLSSLSFKPSKASKFEVGRNHFLNNPKPASEPLTVIVSDIVEKNVDKLTKNEELFHCNHSAEAIHDMRVATRRLRAALKTFKDCLHTKTNKLRTDLQRLGNHLGKQRDLDVFAEFVIKTLPAKSKAIPKLHKLQKESHKQFLRKIASKWYHKLHESLKNLKAIKTAPNVFSFAKTFIQQALKNVLKFAPSIDSTSDEKTLHALRIAMKKLRYVCEFFEPQLAPCVVSFSAWIEKAKKIQDCLGEQQDAIIGSTILSDLKELFSSKEILLLKENYDLKKKRARLSFFGHWKDFWFGVGFRHDHPTTAVELIMNR